LGDVTWVPGDAFRFLRDSAVARDTPDSINLWTLAKFPHERVFAATAADD